MDFLHLSQIIIYPVKGLPGIPLQEAFCEQRGLAQDRRWVIVDAKNRFISQREYPQLTQFSIAPSTSGYAIKHANATIELPVSIDAGERCAITIWDDEVAALIAPTPINTWFSEQLQTKCKLCYMDTAAVRKADPGFAIHDEEVSFADGFPYLIIGEAALELLNSKLDEQLDMNRFRPNLVFAGGYPHQEDDFKAFSIGQVHFYGVKPCSRCVVTTINQEKGTIGKEPLKTLATYRKVGSKIKFGMNVLSKNEGTIRIGDRLEMH